MGARQCSFTHARFSHLSTCSGSPPHRQTSCSQSLILLTSKWQQRHPHVWQAKHWQCYHRLCVTSCGNSGITNKSSGCCNVEGSGKATAVNCYLYLRNRNRNKKDNHIGKALVFVTKISSRIHWLLSSEDQYANRKQSWEHSSDKSVVNSVPRWASLFWT